MGDELQPIIVRKRRRPRAGIVIAALAIASAQAVTLAVALRRPPIHEVPIVMTVPSPPTVVERVERIERVIEAQPTTANNRPACPPVNIDAPAASSLGAMPLGMIGVVTARTNASWIAAWNDEQVQLSVDGGRTFKRVLDGSGRVRAVTFDCYGRVFAIRGGSLGSRDGANEAWRVVPHIQGDSDSPIALLGGGPDAIVVGVRSDADSWNARLAVTPDLGVSWWFRELVDYWETSNVTGRQDADGSIHMTITTADCMRDPVDWIRIVDGEVETDFLDSVGDVQLFDDIAINAGWQGVRWKRFREAEWHAVKGIAPEITDAELFDGPLPRVLADGTLFKITNGRATRIDTKFPEHSGAVDRGGRVWWIHANGENEDSWLLVD